MVMLMNIEKAVVYFKQTPGYERLFDEMIKKYRSYGRIGGEVILRNLSPSECKAISGFYREDVHAAQFKTKLVKFEDKLENSVFDGLSLIDLLVAYVGKEIISNKQLREDKQTKREMFFERLSSRFADMNSQEVLSALPRSYVRLYEEDETKAQNVLIEIFSALTELPLDRYERLPLFAEKITKDPKAFDTDRHGKLLLDGLKVLLDSPDEEDSDLLAAVGILKDDVHNFVSASGLVSNFSFWQRAYEEGAMLNVPLREAEKLTFTTPAVGNNVFVVENTGVFSAILDQFFNRLPPLLCLHGQPKISSLLLLDRLVENGVTIYYAGDFDPEGLLIFERLWKRYGDRIIAWRMGEEEYTSCLSSVVLSDRRISMLKNLHLSYFEHVREKMRYTKLAGYQERLLSLLVEDIQKSFACEKLK